MPNSRANSNDNAPQWNAPSLLAQKRELFDRLLRGFVPDNPFDFHAHLLRRADPSHSPASFQAETVGIESYRSLMTAWMGDRAPQNGLFFPYPARDSESANDNAHCLAEISGTPRSRALLLVRPSDDPAAISDQYDRQRGLIAGIKVYHVYANRSDTMNAAVEEFLPEWVWEIAEQHQLLIMLHLVRARALADPLNQNYIRDHSLRYPNARLILAHAGRGFCSLHTVQGIEALRGLDNVYFDTSAICEPTALVSVLQTFGASRLLFGTDFPICNLVGRCSSVGDGFHWLTEKDIGQSASLGELTLVGIESLLAIQQACRLAHSTDSDVERIFRTNAEELLGLRKKNVERGQLLYSRARTIIPGGTQLLSKRPEMYAPGCWPPYFAEASGVRVVDIDGREYVDMSTMSVGACLLGYADPDVDSAVHQRVTRGSTASLNSDDEVTLADLLLQIHPWAEQVRFARGGGEALSVAVRIARAQTKRSKIAFCGYHGWHDWYLAANRTRAGVVDQLSEHLLRGLDPAGVPAELSGTTLPFAYNQLGQLEALVQAQGNELAAIVLEPTRSQEPAAGFLEGVRELANQCNAALIFDEVSAGWRLCLGGAHLRYGVTPDIAVFSKALANGYPMAAVIGKEGVMKAAEQSFISSTMWSEGIGPAAALATIQKFLSVDVPRHVAAIGERYRSGILAAATRAAVPVNVHGHAAVSTISFGHTQAAELQTLFTTRMLAHGFLVGAAFYPSLAHEERHVDSCIAKAAEVLDELGKAIRRDDIASRLKGPVKHSGFMRLA